MSLLGLEVSYSKTRISLEIRFFTNIFVVYNPIFLNTVMIANKMKQDMNKQYIFIQLPILVKVIEGQKSSYVYV